MRKGTTRRPSVLALALSALLAACVSEVRSPELSVDSATPQTICNAQIVTEVSIAGSGFTPLSTRTFHDTARIELPRIALALRARIDGGAGTLPEIFVPDDFTSPEKNHVRWSSTARMAFDIFPGMAAALPDGPDLPPGLYDLAVENPDLRRATLERSIGIVPPPVLSRALPTPLCNEQDDVSFTLSGTGFVRLGDELPVVRFSTPDGRDLRLEVPAAEVVDCIAPPSPSGVTLFQCRGLTVRVARGGLLPGVYHVAVRNPRETGCTSQEDVRVLVVPAPRLEQAQPSPVCNAQGETSFTLRGAGFIRLDGELPLVRFVAPDGQGVPAQAQASAASECTGVADPNGAMVESCKELSVTLPAGSLSPGSYVVSVKNPRDTGCITQEDVRVVDVAPPSITQMGTIGVCTAQGESELLLSGKGFLIIQDDAGVRGPSVTISGKAFASAASDCLPLEDAPNAQICTTLTIALPKDSLAAGTFALLVRNPAPAACSLAAMLPIEVVPPPTLRAVDPDKMCAGGGTLKLTGTGFRPGARVLVSGVPAAKVTVESATSATASFAGVIRVGGPYDITFRNPDSCEATIAGKITITPGPSVLFVDPPVLPKGYSLQATVYGSGVVPPIKSVEYAPAGGATFTKLDHATDPQFPNRALITVPSNLAAGSYDLKLFDNTICPAFLPGAFKVVDTQAVTVSGVVPGYGTTAQNTAVIISGDGFVAVPRVYLNPTSNPPGSIARALSAVTFQTRTSLTGVVRGGLNPGAYDVLVVNPDGKFGIKTMAYTVTPMNAPPPIVTSVAPSSFVVDRSTPATILGSGFRAGATVTLTCQDAAGAPVPGASAQVTAILPGSISVNLLGKGVLCLLRVTNQDGTYFDYSAVGVTNASLNLNGFTSGAAMTVPRRALSAVAGRPTPVARFVYAIGGDNGSDNMPRNTVEAAPTGLDGTLRPFFTLSQKLPKALSFSGVANVGRFLYLAGGFDGSAATRDVYRAELLDPLRTPQVTDVDIRFDDYDGVTPGSYIYRISATLTAADPHNPGGETLCGDFFPIQIPKLPAGQLQVVLRWSTLPNAAAYKIYRSPQIGDAAGKELLLATVPASAMPLLYVDDGKATPAGDAPLPLGSTGTWRQIVSLNAARIGPGVAAAQSPTDPGKWFLYAAGGNSGTLAAPSALSTVEYLPITVNADGGQDFTTWTATSPLGAARWLAPALVASPDNNSLVPKGKVYLYVSSGSSGSILSAEKRIDVAEVGADGKLTAFADSGSVGVGRTGYGGALVNNLLMAFGGFQTGTAQTNSVTAKLKSATELANFNSLGGGVLTLPRALQGTAIESAFIYQLGGASAAPNTAQSTTEQTVW